MQPGSLYRPGAIKPAEKGARAMQTAGAAEEEETVRINSSLLFFLYIHIFLVRIKSCISDDRGVPPTSHWQRNANPGIMQARQCFERRQ